MPQTASSLHHVGIHGRFTVSGLESVKGSHRERELKREGRLHDVYLERKAGKKPPVAKNADNLCSTLPDRLGHVEILVGQFFIHSQHCK